MRKTVVGLVSAILTFAADAELAPKQSKPLDFGVLQFAAKFPLGDPEVHGFYLLCNNGDCFLTLTRTFARSCTGATPRQPTMIASAEVSTKSGDLAVNQLSASSVQIELTWVLGMSRVKSTLVITYTPDGPNGPFHAFKPVSAIRGNASVTDIVEKRARSYEYTLMRGPVSCDIVFSE
jgi:hypothetical protein